MCSTPDMSGSILSDGITPTSNGSDAALRAIFLFPFMFMRVLILANNTFGDQGIFMI